MKLKNTVFLYVFWVTAYLFSENTAVRLNYDWLTINLIIILQMYTYCSMAWSSDFYR